MLVGGLAFILACASIPAEDVQSAERLSFNAGWCFAKGDPADAFGKLDYGLVKPWIMATGSELLEKTQLPPPQGSLEANIAYAQPNCNDSQWRKLNLPHDWGVEGPFKLEYPGGTGRLPWWGVGWYRKHFTVPATDQGRQVYLDMDGAMAYAMVWLNGHFVGGWPYGYASFRLDLTRYLRPGSDNVIAIRLDNPPDSSRWYPGGGIYRNVWLVKCESVHISHWGAYVTTPRITAHAATVDLEVKVENHTRLEADVSVSAQIYQLNSKGEKNGKPVALSGPNKLKIGANATAIGKLSVEVGNPRLWAVKTPNRYAVVTRVEQGGKIVDVNETAFGIRTIEFSPQNGFRLNGERVPIQGVCDHHDLGALGSALNARALERQVELLQQMGCNAIRTSHNPPAPELLDLCDRMGMVVMDEAFDCWLKGKKTNDYHLLFPEWHEKDLRAMIRRDRNHPCVVLWSIGNEIAEQKSPEGHRVAGELAAIVRQEDPTRPVSAGCDRVEAGYNGFQNQVDVFGYNYKPHQYDKFHQAGPTIPLFGSETASCVSSRGEYFFPVSEDKSLGRADFQVSSYDLYAPPWATTPDTEFRGQDASPWVLGEFVWTGFDYLGEPTPYNSDLSNLLNFSDPAEQARMAKELKELGKIRVPSRSSYFGIFDLAGFKKDRFYLYQSRWRPDLPMAHILPHWTWPERVGQVTPVHVYTSGDEAELFLNGHSLGRKQRGPSDYRLQWNDVVYQPGKLKVIAFKNHRPWAEDVVETASSAARLELRADRPVIKADGRDLFYVTAAVTDQQGRLVPRAKNPISFAVSGPAEIIATDNGDPTSFEPFQSPEHRAFNGLCLVIVRSTGQPGHVILRATSPSLRQAQVKLRTADRD